MSFWSMSVSGGIFILAIVLIRSLFADKLPGKVFQVLWFAAVLRLLLPFSIPSAFSIYSLMADYIPISYSHAEKSVFDILPFLKQGQTDSQEETEEGTSYGQLAEGENGFGQIAEEYKSYDQQAETENMAEQEEPLRQERDVFQSGSVYIGAEQGYAVCIICLLIFAASENFKLLCQWKKRYCKRRSTPFQLDVRLQSANGIWRQLP